MRRYTVRVMILQINKLAQGKYQWILNLQVSDIYFDWLNSFKCNTESLSLL